MIEIKIIGHLGRDATINNVNGKSVINFNVAHSFSYTDQGGTKQTKTTWADCAYWTDKTTIGQYLKKGTQVYVSGEPEAKSFQKQDGSCGASLTIRVFQVQLLGSPQPQQPAAATTQQTTTTQQPTATPAAANSGGWNGDPDSLPF